MGFDEMDDDMKTISNRTANPLYMMPSSGEVGSFQLSARPWWWTGLIFR